MTIKIFIDDGNESELFSEKEVNVHTANMFLSAKSLYFDNALYDVTESVLSYAEKEIQITVEER